MWLTLARRVTIHPSFKGRIIFVCRVDGRRTYRNNPKCKEVLSITGGPVRIVGRVTAGMDVIDILLVGFAILG